MSQSLVTRRILDHTIEAYRQRLKYPGAFHPNVEKKVKQIVGNKYCVHLFSGSSTLGSIRVDIENPHATLHANVKEYIKKPIKTPHPSIILLDPDYAIQRAEKKLKGHGITSAISADVPARRNLKKFIYESEFDEILYLDYPSPRFYGYREKDFWRVIDGGWHNNRTLTWYEKESKSLMTFTKEGECKT